MNRMYQASGPAPCHLPKARWLAALLSPHLFGTLLYTYPLLPWVRARQ